MRLKEYCERICEEIDKYCTKEITKSNLETVLFLLDCLNKIKNYDKDDSVYGVVFKDASMEHHHYHEHHEHHHLSETDVNDWFLNMENASGTMGQTWNIMETNKIAEQLFIDKQVVPDYVWNVAVNMMYSDYYEVAVKYGVNTPLFYGCLAKAFLFDKDAKSPIDKITEYYEHIVK